MKLFVNANEVAQISNLLYRRIAFGRASVFSKVLCASRGPQIENLRYSRLQICATTVAAVFGGLR